MVSVIIPTYNCGNKIINAINSVLNQTYKGYEIIVVDDGSTDNTKIVLSQFGDQIRYLYQSNKGPSAARNYGVRESRGEYIAFLDADDLWSVEKLEKSINFMDRNNFDWICTSMLKIRRSGESFIKRIPEGSWVLDSKTKEIRQLKNGLFFFSSIPVHTPTIVIRKKCIESVGLFDETILIGEDTDLWLRFEETGLRGGYLDEPLTVYQYNEKSITRLKKVDGLKEHAKVACKHAKILGWNKSIIKETHSDFLWQIADIYWSNKRYGNAVKYILRSFLRNPRKVFKITRKFYCPRGILNNKVNILYYEPTTGFGGSSRCLLGWLHELDRDKFNPLVITHYNGPAIKKMREIGIRVINTPFIPISDQIQWPIVPYLLLGLNLLFFVLPVSIILLVQIKRYKINLIHLNAKIIASIPGILASKLSGVPCICHLHDIKELIKREKFFARYVDCFIGLTEKGVELYRKEIPGKRIMLIPNGIDLSNYELKVEKNVVKSSLGILNGDMVVGIVGRLVEGKGFSDFIRAAKLVSNEAPNVKFVIVGSADKINKQYEMSLKKLANDLGLRDKVVFTGWREDVPQIMSAMDILVQASSTFREGFGLTCIEAMALRKPVIATNIPGPSEIVVNGETGLIVTPANTEELANAMLTIINNRDLADKFSQAGRKRVEEHFEIRKNTQRIEELYEEILGRRD